LGGGGYNKKKKRGGERKPTPWFPKGKKGGKKGRNWIKG